MSNAFGNTVCSPVNGMSVSEAWIFLFEFNEQCRREKKFSMIYTDDRVSELMLAFFPQREGVKLFWQVRRVRASYNRGALAGMGGKPPKRKSWEYVRIGKLIQRR